MGPPDKLEKSLSGAFLLCSNGAARAIFLVWRRCLRSSRWASVLAAQWLSHRRCHLWLIVSGQQWDTLSRLFRYPALKDPSTGWSRLAALDAPESSLKTSGSLACWDACRPSLWDSPKNRKIYLLRPNLPRRGRIRPDRFNNHHCCAPEFSGTALLTVSISLFHQYNKIT